MSEIPTPDENDPLWQPMREPDIPKGIADHLAAMGMQVATLPVPHTPLRCSSCGYSRTRNYITFKGIKYLETSGARCPSCGMPGTLADLEEDAFDREAANFFNRQEHRVEIEDAADKMATFYNALTDRGVNDHFAGAAMMAFGVGHIEPEDFTDWKRGETDG